MKSLQVYLPFALICILLSPFFGTYSLSAQQYQVGDIVENFTLTDRSSGLPVSLSDLEGRIILLDWFTWWCPFCQAAAPQLMDGIDRHYGARAGNPDGISVVHVGINLEANNEAKTQDYVSSAGLQRVWEDFNRALANRFIDFGQPIFAIINGVAGSPSHEQWELLYVQAGLGQLTFPISTMRAAIDAVQAAPPVEGITFQMQPKGNVVQEGEMINLSVTTSGTDPITYRWYRNNMLIENATMASLTLTSLKSGDSGDYRVEVENPAGIVWSDVAEVTVLSRPYLRGLAFQPNGEARVQLQAHSGYSYHIEYSSDLVNWITLDTVIAESDLSEVPDAGASDVMMRFYRVMWDPLR